MTFNVKGYVTDAIDHSKIPGATILVKNTQSGTTSDPNGYYSIVAPLQSSILRCSFIGYQTQEIAINGDASINFYLQPDLAE